MDSFHVEARRPTPEEVQEICDLFNRVWGKVYNDKGWYYYTPDVFNWYVGNPRNDPESYFIVFDDETNNIIGYFGISSFEMAINGQDSYQFGYPTMITVDLDYQSKGIGKLLGTQVKSFYERKGYIGGF